MGIRILESTVTYRKGTNGTASDSGVVHVCPVMGANAFGVVDLENVHVIMNDKLSALNMYYSYGWKMTFGVKTLNSSFGIGVASYEGA